MSARCVIGCPVHGNATKIQLRQALGHLLMIALGTPNRWRPNLVADGLLTQTEQSGARSDFDKDRASLRRSRLNGLVETNAFAHLPLPVLRGTRLLQSQNPAGYGRNQCDPRFGKTDAASHLFGKFTGNLLH